MRYVEPSVSTIVHNATDFPWSRRRRKAGIRAGKSLLMANPCCAISVKLAQVARRRTPDTAPPGFVACAIGAWNGFPVPFRALRRKADNETRLCLLRKGEELTKAGSERPL